jgi:hypothetical protein
MTALTPEMLEQEEMSENEVLALVNQDYLGKYGFSDAEDYVFKAERGLDQRSHSAHVGHEGRAGMDAG